MKKIYSILLIVLLCGIFNQFNAQIIITDNENANPHPSAMLEIQSTDKGLLIPRMTSVQRESISNPQEGLLVYDSDLASFFLYGKNSSGEPAWNNLSTPGSIWQTNSSNVFLSDAFTNVGIGTGSSPSGKLVIKADPGKAPDDVLFEIQDSNGQPVFVVTSVGARIYIDDVSKGATGGFAVGRYGIAKGYPDTTFFMVSPDSTRVFTKENGKGAAGGFAVGRYGIAKSIEGYTFYTGKDSTRIYTDNPTKGAAGGFAVGRYGIAKGTNDNYMFMVPDNYFIGHQAGEALQTHPAYTGIYNTFFGFQSGLVDNAGSNNVFIGYKTGIDNLAGSYNIFLGNMAGYNNTGVIAGSDTSGSRNIFLGYQAGYSNTTGSNNLFLGFKSGHSLLSGTGNTFLGNNAGAGATGGIDNIFIGSLAGNFQASGNNNIYLGNSAGAGQSASITNNGQENIFIGTSSGVDNRYGKYNVFMGYETGINNLGVNGSNTYGNNNVFIGYRAGYTNEYAYKNVFIGYEAGYSIQGSTISDMGSNNVFIGNGAGRNTTGSVANIAIGNNAGAEGGFLNTFVGNSAGNKQTGSDNAFFGYHAGQNSTSGDGNVCVGSQAGENLTLGNMNILIGYGAGNGCTYAENNIAIGFNSGRLMHGQYNILIGDQTGYNLSTSDNGNILIGYQAGYYETGSDNLYIENSNSSVPLIYGNFGTDLVGINERYPSAYLHVKQISSTDGFAIENDDIGGSDIWSWNIGANDLQLYYNATYVGYWNDADGSYTGISDKNLKKDISYLDSEILSKVMKLKPASYRLLHAESESEKTIGFIAQDVEVYFPELVKHAENGYLGLNYSDFAIIAIKAIQEQQVIIEEQKTENEKRKIENQSQNMEIESLKKQIEELKTLINNK